MVKHTEDLDSIHSTHTDLIPSSDLTGHVYDVQTCRENTHSKEGGKEGGRGGERTEWREGDRERGKAGQKFIKPTSAKHTNLKLKNNIMGEKMGSKRSKRTEVSKAELAIRCTSPRAGGGGAVYGGLNFFPQAPREV